MKGPIRMATPQEQPKKPNGPPSKPASTPPGKPAATPQGSAKPGKPAPAKPQPPADASQMVPARTATVYKLLPLSVRDRVLTIAMGDPSNLAAIDDVRNLRGIPEVLVQLAPPKAIADALTKAYAGKEESIIDI